LGGAPRPGILLVDRDSWHTARQWVAPAGLEPRGLRFRPDGKQLALHGGRQAVIWDLPDGREKTYALSARAGWQKVVSEAAFLAAGRLLVVEQIRKDKQVRLSVRDLVSGGEVGAGVTITPSGQIGAGAKVTINGEPWVPPTNIEPLLSDEGRLLLSRPGTFLPWQDPISIWDVNLGDSLGELSCPDLGFGLHEMISGMSANGSWLYHLNYASNDIMNPNLSVLRLRIWNIPDRRHHWDLRFSDELASAAISANGRLLAVGYAHGAVELWDVPDRELVFEWWPAGGSTIKHLAFAPDAAYLACDDGQAPVRLLHLAELRRQLADIGLDW
jgi:WD40 repeat protein